MRRGALWTGQAGLGNAIVLDLGSILGEEGLEEFIECGHGERLRFHNGEPHVNWVNKS